MEIDPESGLKASVISRSDLIAAKLAAARPQDMIDVAALRQTEQQQTAQTNDQEKTDGEELEKQRQQEREQDRS